MTVFHLPRLRHYTIGLTFLKEDEQAKIRRPHNTIVTTRQVWMAGYNQVYFHFQYMHVCMYVCMYTRLRVQG